MKKLSFAFVVVISIVCALLANIFFGHYLTAKISTLPLLNSLHLVHPDAPIVITNRQEIHVSDGGDLLQAVNNSKSKISTVVTGESNQVAVAGGAINITSDGIFVTAAPVFSSSSAHWVVLNDGRISKITDFVQDPATGLAFFKADIQDVSVAPLGISEELNPGDVLLFMINSPRSYIPRVSTGVVSISQRDIEHQTYDADKETRTFFAQAPSSATPGQAVVSIKGDVVGLWNGNVIISSDVLKQAVGKYLTNRSRIQRPSFGFSYNIITKADNAVTGSPEGARVVAVSKPAKPIDQNQLSLMQGDIITAVDGQKINEVNVLEKILLNYKPGDIISLTVMRGKQPITVLLNVGELK